MRKYVSLLVILISIGVVLAYFVFKNSFKDTEEVYLQTTASIRNLKLIDNDINILLFKIRHQNQNNYDDLEELSFAISEEFDNLRFEALFEEIDKSPELSAATEKFDQVLKEKQQSISAFIESNQRLAQANDDILSLSSTNSSIRELFKRLSIEEEINTLVVNFYRFLQDSSPENQKHLNTSITYIRTLIDKNNKDAQNIVHDYIKTLSDFIANSENNERHFTNTVNLETSETLTELEKSYVNYQNRILGQSSNLQTALIVYGFILLLVLLIFAYQLWKQYQNLEQQVADRTEEIAKAYEDLKESQEQLIQSEKMASLGEMVAGVAHEINTPLGYVSSNVDTIKINVDDIEAVLTRLYDIYKEAKSSTRSNKKICQLLSDTLKQYVHLRRDGIIDESQQLLEDSHHGLEEISKLVSSLKDFARLDRQSTDAVDIHHCIESSLKIASNHIKNNQVQVAREFDDLPNIVCTPSKINQLFLNIITNSCQAMKENGGKLTIKSQLDGNHITVSFIDQGKGMDEPTMQKMFNPFFTTKPIGEGTGLGMSIAYKIVQGHRGDIRVQSKLGMGTAIDIQLPIDAKAA